MNGNNFGDYSSLCVAPSSGQAFNDILIGFSCTLCLKMHANKLNHDGEHGKYLLNISIFIVSMLA